MHRYFRPLLIVTRELAMRNPPRNSTGRRLSRCERGGGERASPPWTLFFVDKPMRVSSSPHCPRSPRSPHCGLEVLPVLLLGLVLLLLLRVRLRVTPDVFLERGVLVGLSKLDLLE